MASTQPARLLGLLLGILLAAGCGTASMSVDPGGSDPLPAPAPSPAADPPPLAAPDADPTPAADPTPDPSPDPDPAPPAPPAPPVAADAGTSAPPPACNTQFSPPAPFTGVNTDPAFLQVYVNNVENLETPTEQCTGDWKDLFYEMARRPSPDLFLVQQISDQAQLDLLVQHMTTVLPGAYAGIIAEVDPAPMNSPCGAPKDKQTNAIIYRTGRLTPVGSKHVWQSWAKLNDVCKRNFQARTMNVMQKFLDQRSGKTVSVASLHWSTFQGAGPDPSCAELNAAEVARKLALPGFGGDLLIFGGDMNEPDQSTGGGFRPWYRDANGELGAGQGFRDAIYARCAKSGSPQQCLDDNWTIGQARRIDFLFARTGAGCLPGMSGQHTITFEEADAAAAAAAGGDSAYNYSDHRAIRAQVHY